MKLVVPIALREYPHADEALEGDDLYIAQTVSDPIISSCGPGPKEAIEEMRRVLSDFLSRVHPRYFWATHDLERPWIIRAQYPLFRASMFDWQTGYNPQLKEYDVESALDVMVTPRPGGFLQISLPSIGLATLVQPEPEEMADFEEFEGEVSLESRPALKEVLDEFATDLKENNQLTQLHRPRPLDISIVDVEVEFEPLDLTRIDPDELWSDAFAKESIASDDPDEITTPALDSVAQNYSQLGLFECFERDDLRREVKALLLAKESQPVVIIGAPRVGKTALIRHLAWDLFSDKNGGAMWFCDPPRLVANDPMSAGWQQQVRDIVAELEATKDVLYLGRLIEALDAGKYMGSDYNLAQFLKPTLVDRRIRVIAEASIEEWTEIERRDVGFARCFTTVRLEELPAMANHSVIAKASAREAKALGITLEPAAIERARHLQFRFSTEGSPAGRTIDFLKRTLKHAANRYKTTVGVDDIIASFCADTGLPSLLVDDRRELDIDQVVARLMTRVKGQDEAVKRVADVIGITKTGLASEDRPLSSFLFVGPTGVGKTELARALAEFLFGNHERMIRLDMSEYSHADAYTRLIGEGREDGDLTGPVRRQPFCVVLLDEIEKAHPGVFDVLLQVLGEARLTDVKGRVTRFQNVIFIMTSNLGVDSLRPAIGFEQNESQDNYARHFRREAERFFRPEFLARIDQFIAFRALTLPVVEAIASRELESIHQRDGLRAQDVDLTFSDELPGWLAERGFDSKYGARPLKRVIESEVVWSVAEALAANPAETGMSRAVDVSVKANRVKASVRMVSGDATVASARQQLLSQIDEISDLRRKVQRHMLSHIFLDREWEVEHFDLSSQSRTFWSDPHAPSLSQRAETARKVVIPVQNVAAELAALEDLATEAFHARTFVISKDLTERLDELRDRVSRIGLSLLRAAEDDPDRALLFLISKQHDDPWRTRLVEWYIKRAKAKGWEVSLWQPLADWHEIPRAKDQEWDIEREFWEEVPKNPRGLVIGLEITGYAARPLHMAENGLHRQIAVEGNHVCDVVALGPYDGWPFPDTFTQARANAQVVRSFNFRTSEITMPNSEPIKLVADNPWPLMEDTVESLVWPMVEDDWGEA